MPLGSEKVGFMGAAGGVGGNYFGDGSDGALSTSGDVTETVLNKVGSYDGDMLVKNYASVTIGSGDTFTVDQPCRGMLIYVKGNFTCAGTLSARMGGFADPTGTASSDSQAVNASGLRIAMLTASGSDTLALADLKGSGDNAIAAVGNNPEVAGDGTIYTISKTGGTGGAQHNLTGPANGQQYFSAGTDGADGTETAVIGQTGGGATGGYSFSGGNSGGNITGGLGGLGGAFSGGAGGGSIAYTIGSSPGFNLTIGTPSDYGGGGGGGVRNWSAQTSASGGAGNPGGGGGGNYGNDGEDVCGGILWLIVGGDVSISGTVTAKGGSSGNANGGGMAGGSTGGGSGGGVLMILHGGSYSNTGTVTADGGVPGNAQAASQKGGIGGDGAVIVSQVEA